MLQQAADLGGFAHALATLEGDEAGAAGCWRLGGRHLIQEFIPCSIARSGVL
jgi:hypothetical protein